MNVLYDVRIQGEVVNLLPGEYGASREERIFTTVLGSCVAVVLHDPKTGVGGMNHFMLPGSVSERRFYLTESGRYGMYAMELLVNEVVKMGGERSRLIAKVFGGGSVMRGAGFHSNVPGDNVAFALDYLGAEGIPVASRHVGGDFGRKIYLFATSGRVLLRRIGRDQIEPVEHEELAYLQRTRREAQQSAARLTLFREAG